MKRIGLIFDVDGTLWDSRKVVSESWSEVTKKYGLRPVSEEDMTKTMGMPMTGIADTLFGDLSQDKRLALLNECTANELDYLKKHPGTLYDEVEKTLSFLKERGFHLYILSNAQPGYIEAFLEGTKLGRYFEDYICWGDNGFPKSENMKILSSRNHLDAFYYIGDTGMDEQEANKANAPFVHASYGFGKADHPFYVLKKFSDLTNFPSFLHL